MADRTNPAMTRTEKVGVAALNVVTVYRQPQRFDTPEDYERQLTDALDVLCIAIGVRPPYDIPSAWEQTQPVQGPDLACGEVRETGPRSDYVCEICGADVNQPHDPAVHVAAAEAQQRSRRSA